MTQTDRIVAFIRANPGCTTMQIQYGLEPFVANPRGRISDARAQGVAIECRKRADGRLGYYIREARPAPLSGQQESLAL